MSPYGAAVSQCRQESNQYNPLVRCIERSEGFGNQHFAVLRELVRNERERRWQQDNADFIAAYNQTVTDEGLPLDSWRSF
ncbi:MAG: type II toxin-antitoxin system CcdA family antitoxin [Methylobacter sp.]